MQCVYPKWLEWAQMTVPCNRCIACRIARTREWTTRLMHEARYHDDNCFLTLTYRDEDLPIDGSLSKRELQLFIKRLRKYLGDKKIKYYGCGEYGEEGDRPHYHLIVFGWMPRDLKVASVKGGKKRWKSILLEKLWPYGFNTVGVVEHDSIQYVVGYIRKSYFNPKSTLFKQRQSPFPLASKGLGLQFALGNQEQIKRDLFVRENGKPVGLPRYYKKKLEIDSELLYAERLRKDKELLDNYRNVESERLLKLIQESRRQREKNLKAEYKAKGKKI